MVFELPEALASVRQVPWWTEGDLGVRSISALCVGRMPQALMI